MPILLDGIWRLLEDYNVLDFALQFSSKFGFDGFKVFWHWVYVSIKVPMVALTLLQQGTGDC